MFESASKQKESTSTARQKTSESSHPDRAPNAATVQLGSLIRNAQIQAKLKVGQPDDKYEQEADQMADRVMTAPDPAIKPSSFPAVTMTPPLPPATPPAVPIPYPNIGRIGGSSGTVKKVKITPKNLLIKDASNFKTSTGDEPATSQQGIVSQRDPRFAKTAYLSVLGEEEKKRLQPQEEEEEAVQPQLIQRQPAEEEEPVQEKPQLQRQEEEEEELVQAKGASSARQVPESTEAAIRSGKGGGAPLAPQVRTQMENHLRADFSRVRIHNDSESAQLADSIGAQAFTCGNDVYFSAGKYAPGSGAGQALLAHELTHVIQQGAARQRGAQEETRNKELETQSAAAPVAEPVGTERTATEAAPARPQEPEVENEAQAETVAEEQAEQPAVGDFLRKSSEAAFKAKTAKVGRLAGNEKKKETAATKLTQTEAAVVPPSEEAQSRANTQQVETVDQAAQPRPDEAQAKQGLSRALESAVPRSLEEVDSFKQRGQGRVVGQAVKSLVAADTQAVKSTYEQIENTPAPAPAEKAEALPEVEKAPGTEALNLGEGVVGEVQAEHTDLSEFDTQSDELMEEEGIKEEQLEMVDSGPLAEAKADRKQLKQTVKQGPEEVKALEQQQKQQLNLELKTEERAGRQQMRAERNRQLRGSQGEQKKTKSKLELERQQVTDRVNGIYQQANTTVKQKLADLEKKALKDFDKGQQRATRTFEDNVNRRMKAFKKWRYDRLGGSLLWAKDKLFGMDDLPQVKYIFDSEKAAFITLINNLITAITNENKRVIQECREIISTARAAIKTFVEGLKPALIKTGQDALKKVKGKLAALDQAVTAKEQELKQKLAEKREAAIKMIEEKIAQMKEAMSGLISKLGNLLLNAMVKFFEWALKKAGLASKRLMEIINKGKQIIKKIVTDPIGFIKNIVKAVKDGIDRFVTNIKKHLISGLISWLTGAMQDVPITLPEKFNLKGVLDLVMQILGLTWANIRVKLVKRLGEKAVSAAEKTVDIVKRLIKDGPLALWEMLKEKAAAIKQQVMEGIRNWVITQVVKQAVIKLVSFLNPAGAIIQAILAIYNTIMFFVENWQRIVTFVKTVFSSIADIAMGKLSAASQAVEKAMAMTIPIILNFLSRLLGLSGIGKAVSDVIKKIRKPIDRVVTKAIDGVVKLAKKVLKKGKEGAKALKEKGLAVIQWWTSKKVFKNQAGETHTIKFRGKGASAELIVASSPKAIELFMKDAGIEPSNSKYSLVLNLVRQIKTITRSAKKKDPVDRKEAAQITEKMTELSQLLAVVDSGTLELPSSADWASPSGDPTKTKRVEKLSTKTSQAGSTPSGSNEEFDLLRSKKMTTQGDKWVRMHLISEQVGGRGTVDNWVPAPNSVNTGGKVRNFEVAVENLVKKKDKEKPNVIWVESGVTKSRPASPVTGGLPCFPQNVLFRAGLYVPRKGEWVKNSTTRISEFVSIPEPLGGVLPSVARPSYTALKALDPVFSNLTVKRMKAVRAFSSQADFIKQLKKVDAGSQWQKKVPLVEQAITELIKAGKLTLN